MKTIHTILKEYWGHDAFRPGQEEIIQSVSEGNDTLAILPTGGGKSVCFQVPAMMTEGICLVVSPLIALIKDQVEHLKEMGIGALAVYSGMSFTETKQTLQNAAFGNYKFLYVSPERLETKLFLEFLPALKPSLIAVDEAHCISQWGYDFRPAYLRIANLREEMPEVPVIALTASATPEVQSDICDKLLFGKTALRFRKSFARAELSYSAFNPPAKENKLLEILQNVKGAAIVYCRSRRKTQEIAKLLQLNSINADFYHAGLPAADRTAKQDAWIQNKIRTIVCTNAFGMGIDKADVRVVIHFEVPECLENYYQEAGRAGRDGKRSYAVLLFLKKEPEDLFFKLEARYPSPEKLVVIYKALMNHFAVAAGSGEGISYDIDIALFAQNFKLNITEAVYGIQALAQEGLLVFNEYVFKNATVEFITDKNALSDFETIHPEMEYLIKGLLRSYEGIFDRPVIIYERLLAGFLKTPVEKINADLQILKNYKIIELVQPSGKPQILLLKNRMYNDDIKINPAAISQRKLKALERTKSMSGFVNDHIRCRSRLISLYFGEISSADCGICDNCINNASAKLSSVDFQVTVDAITKLVSEERVTCREVELRLKPQRERSTRLVAEYLLAEEIIETDTQNFLVLKKQNKGADGGRGQKKGPR